MRKNLIILILAANGLFSYGQIGKSKPDKVATDIDASDSTKNKEQKTQTDIPNSFIESEFKFTDSAGKDVIIQNSKTKGGGNIDGDRDLNAVRGYDDSTGIHYAHAIWWTRIINETTSPLELSINFPADSLRIIPPPDNNYFRLFFPSDTMTVNKLSSYNYGITGLRSFFDSNFNKPTGLKTKINPNEEYFFYVTMLMQMPNQRDSQRWEGPTRAGIVLKEQNLFYKVSVGSLGTKLIPIGQFVLKN